MNMEDLDHPNPHVNASGTLKVCLASFMKQTTRVGNRSWFWVGLLLGPAWNEQASGKGGLVQANVGARYKRFSSFKSDLWPEGATMIMDALKKNSTVRAVLMGADGNHLQLFAL